MSFLTELSSILADRSCFLCGEESSLPICPTCVASFRSCDPGWIESKVQSTTIRGFAAYWYEGAMRKAILQMKVQGEYQLASQLAELMCQKAASLLIPRDSIFVPVPRFGQAPAFDRHHFPQVASRLLARQFGGEALQSALLKIRRTHLQTELSDAQRLLNVADVFAVSPECGARLKNRSIIIVDDVVTTGATIKASFAATSEAHPAQCLYLTLSRSRATIQAGF